MGNTSIRALSHSTVTGHTHVKEQCINNLHLQLDLCTRTILHTTVQRQNKKKTEFITIKNSAMTIHFMIRQNYGHH